MSDLTGAWSCEPEVLVERFGSALEWRINGARCIERVRSPYQLIEVFETEQFGRLYRLDGRLMASQADEFICHEAVVHPAAINHPAPVTALVIGGGDGGAAKQLLKHPSMGHVVLVEQDAAVIDMAVRLFPTMTEGVFCDSRLELVVSDAYRWVGESADVFDLAVLDLTEPDTQAAQFYTADFFSRIRRRLNPTGALCLSLGSPVFQAERVSTTLRALREHFAIVRPALVYVPLYGTIWAVAVASDTLDPHLLPSVVSERIAERGLDSCRYYHAGLHSAMFALPLCWQPVCEK